MDDRDDNLNRHPIRKLPKRVCLGRLCAVCNDMATGMHYGIYTCNGCEAFFRRTVINNRQFRCSRGGTCVINCQERCVCRACRYEKCLMVGMDRESVHCNKNHTTPSSSASSEQNSTPTPMPSPRSPYSAEMNTLLNLENRLRQLRLYDLPMQRSLVESLTLPSLFDAPKIELLRCAESYEPSQLDESLSRVAAWVRKDCVLFTEYAKCFPVFVQLSLVDKIKIVQNNTLIQQTLTQAYHTCDFGPDTIVHPDGCSIDRQSHPEDQQPCSSNNQAFNELWTREEDGPKVSSITAKMIDRLVLPMRENRVEMIEVALLRVLLFLDPAQDCISLEAREVLEEERRKYFSLLLSYAIEKHGVNGSQRFAFILLLSNALQEVAIDMKRALVTFDFFATSTEKDVAFPDSVLDNNILDRRTNNCTNDRRQQSFTS